MYEYICWYVIGMFRALCCMGYTPTLWSNWTELLRPVRASVSATVGVVGRGAVSCTSSVPKEVKSARSSCWWYWVGKASPEQHCTDSGLYTEQDAPENLGSGGRRSCWSSVSSGRGT